MKLMISEVLQKAHNAKTKAAKIKILKENNTPALRMIFVANFDDSLTSRLPPGEDIPYRKNEAPAGTEHTRLASEAKKLYHYIKGADNDTPQVRKETMFIQLLEGLHSSEAELVINAKDKRLHQVYKGLSKDLVKQAFDWNEEFNRKV